MNAPKNSMIAGINPATPVVIGNASMPAPICVPATNKIQPMVLLFSDASTEFSLLKSQIQLDQCTMTRVCLNLMSQQVKYQFILKQLCSALRFFSLL